MHNGFRLFLALLFVALPVLAQNPATSVNVDANANRHPINPNIYGIAYGDAHDMSALNPSLNRWGGNSTSRYNWQIDAHSAGADWYFETYSDGSGVASGSADAWVATTRSAHNGAEPMFTIPMIDYLANLGANRSTLEGFSVKTYGAQTATDPWNSDAGNGVCAGSGKYCTGSGANVAGNSPLDTGVANSTTIQKNWVQHFVNTFGPASASTGIKYYILDNEPSIWHSTHRDVHPIPADYAEVYNKIVAYAGAIRAADPTAKIVGPEEWGWWAMYFSGYDQANGTGSASDYATHNNTYYYPWLLQQLHAYKQQTGTDLLDVLTVHCYNDGPGSDDSVATQKARNAQTRILWDSSFQDPYWYGDIGINGRVLAWIPTLKAMVSQYYPGLQIGCTEYNWGDEANLNGATTQADVLGIYGREGFDLATRWTVADDTNTTPTTYYVTYLASQIYRNYDGNNSAFGDTSVAATVANPDNLSAFSAVRSSDGALTVMVINKQQGSTPVTVSLAHFANTGTAQAWQINSAAQTSIAHLADVAVTSNAISTTVPSQSITLFVIPAGSIVSPPTAPTGLAASVGSGTVTLTWNAGGGATSYTVKRANVSGGPYTTLGTVTSPAPTQYNDTGLANGTTYYYVVSGTNSAGTGPNSAELAATPMVPPVFTSSATASPNPVTQGNSTTVTAKVTDTANTLTNGIVQVVVLDASGGTAASQNFTGQSFTLNQSHNYTVTFSPTTSGAFEVQVGVFSATWQQWHWDSSAGSITVNSSLTFSSSASASPSTVARGSSTLVTFSVTDTGTASLSNANVEMQVFDGGGNATATDVVSGQSFTANQTHQYTYTWGVPVSQATGNYTVMIGVFDAGWGTGYYWNSNGATITVVAAQSPPPAPTGLKATAGDRQVALTWNASTGAASYNVYRGAAAGSEGTSPFKTGVTSTSYIDAGLTNGSPYFYKVAGVNGGGTGAFSTEASATPQNHAPTVTSLSPIASSGASQTYTFQVSDPDGYQDLGVVNVLINGYLDGRHACYIAYSQQSNTVFLVDDAGDAGGPFAGSIVPGVTGSASNGQCAVNGTGSSVSGSVNTLTLTLNMNFTAAFAGNRVVYVAAGDAAGLNSGWQTMGVHGVPPLSATYPRPVSMSPSSGSTANPTLIFTFQDASDAGNLQTGWALINTAIDGRQGCFLAYYRPGNQVYLYPDNGDGTQATSMVLTGTNTVTNSQCTVSAQGSLVTMNGAQMIVSLNVAFKTAFAGFKGVWMAAQTMNGAQTSDWQPLGAWNVP
jgi:Glycoside hydrolase family 44